MDGQNASVLARRAFQQFDMPRLPNCWREILRDDGILLAFPNSCHQEDASFDSGTAQGLALGGVGYAKPGCPVRFERPCALDRSVAITVGLDYGADRDARANMFLNCVKIFSQSSQRNLRPSSAIENQGADFRQAGKICARSVHGTDYSDLHTPPGLPLVTPFVSLF